MHYRCERQLDYERQAALRMEEDRKQQKKLLVVIVPLSVCLICAHTDAQMVLLV